MSESLTAGFSRRDFCRFGLGGLFGLSQSGWLADLARGAEHKRPRRSCILLWMTGGPSQLDTFDPKPGASTGGPFQAIQTSAPGLQWSEHLPKLARHM